MKNWRSVLVVLIIGVSFLAQGCALSYKKGFLDRAANKGYTKEQALAAYYMSFRWYFSREVEKGKYQVVYSRLPMEVVQKQMERYLSDLSAILDYKEEEMSKFLDIHGLRPYFEHQEKVEQAIYARVRAAMIFAKFQELTGTRSYYSHGHGDLSMWGGYDPKIFVITNFDEGLPFRSDVIDKAKASGILKPIETVRVEHSSIYNRKDPDPSDPLDHNKFIWRSKEYSIEAVRYKIVDDEKPRDNYGNYIEAFRIFRGKKESKPALRAFLDGRGSSAIVIVDDDKEGKDIGFGLPDSITTMNENAVLKEESLAGLFPEQENEKRIPPQLKPVRMEIVKIGETVSAWEESKDSKGWTAPEGYQAKPLKNNYNIKIKFVKPEMRDMQSVSMTKKMEAIVKEWIRPGERYAASNFQVLEFFRLKDPYDKEISAAHVRADENTQKISVILLNGEERTGMIVSGNNIFIQENPFAIEYTLGDKRYRIQDDNNDGIYEKRKEISKPVADETGTYAH